MTTSSSASPGPIKFVEPPSTTTTTDSSSSSSFSISSSSSLTDPPHLILYCLPHAGGSPSSFREWQKYADNLLGQGEGGGSSNRVQIRVLSLPGRGGRFDEVPWDDWGFDPDVVDGNTTAMKYVPYRGNFISALTHAFLSDWDGMTPYAFFGHSFGTLLSYELILQLDRLHIRPLPLVSIVSAHRAPGISPELGGIVQTHTLPRDKFVDCIRSWGLVPDTALDNDDLVNIMVPALRADLKLDETHVPPPPAANCNNGDGDGVRKLPVPMVVYGGTNDQTVPSHQLEAWRNVAMSPPSSSGGSSVGGSLTYDEIWFDGDHFYTVTHLAELMADLGKRLKRLLDEVERSIMVGGALGRTSFTAGGSRDGAAAKDHCLIERDGVKQGEDGDEISKVTAARIATENDDDDSLTVLDLFFAQVRRTPNFLAMVDETGNEWSYTELGGAVVKLGEYLIRMVDGEEISRSVDVSAGTATAEYNATKEQHPARVGIFLHHASSYLLANLSSWYAGCSVVLLERNWTGALLREFINVCKVDVVMTDNDGMDRLRGAGLSDEDCGHVEIMDEEEEKDASAESESSTTIQSHPCPRIVIVSSGGDLDGSVSGSVVRYGPKGMEPDDVAFVSMTSGSTGKPSAVLTTHRGTKFCFEARYKMYPFRTTPEELQEREGANVFFAWESLRPLLRGHVTVIIPDEIILSPPHFVNFLRKNKITRLVVTPSLLESVFAYPHLGETLHEKLDHMYGWFLMGEVVPMRLIERAEKLFPNDVQLINAYSSWEALDVSYSDLLPLKQCQIKLGDTGDHGHSGFTDVSAIDKTPPYAPVGYPVPNVYALLLDEYDRPVPCGVPGTLHILTPALALGYLDDPAKTSTRFRQVPPQVSAALLNVHLDMQSSQLGIDEGQGALLFNSGDVGRILSDGQLGLLGRGDDTVKLRGYKVGIPFVESTLNGIDGVVTAVVLPILDDMSQQPDFLVAYIIGREGKPSDKELDAIAKCSRELLPSYAVPRDFIGLAKLPLRAGESRKLDQNALPVPPSLIKKREGIIKGEGEGRRSKPTKQQAVEEPTKALSGPILYQKPTNRLEQIISQAWVETLHLDHEDAKLKAGAVSRTDNFFDVGGNSLLASELIGRLSSQYGLPLSVLDLYEHSSLGALIGYCQGLSKERADANKNDLKTSKHSSLRHRRRKFRSSAKYSGKIAIVGMSGKFPGAPTLDEFWQNIQFGKDSLRTFSKSELAAHGLSPDVYNNPKWIPVGQVLDDADKFDATFWDISPREAKMMDPQHRVFLEVAWSALEDAGYPPQSSPDGPRTGVWAACGIDGYLVHHLKGGGLTTPLDPTNLFLTEVGNEKDYISTRVSYALDLGGPSMTVTSACSSGLVAVAQAAQSLMVGQIDVAIAGASSLTFPNVGYCYEEGMVGSADGHVRPFDEEASGTLFGDGVGAVVLKRLEDAIDDGDHIWSLLTGFDITNDGRQKAGYAAPSASAQAASIVGAMDMAGVSSEQISYVECHATATHVGDAIELRGLSEAFQATAEGQVIPCRCALGSVKGNIGHANCAAGISGLIKTVMMIKNRVITPTAHFARLNAKLTDYLDQESSPFYINRDLKPWDVSCEQLPRRAGVSSFGIGGTNAHVVLEDFVSSTPNHQEQEACCGSALNFASNVCILPISAKTIGALKRNVDNLAAHLKALVQIGGDSTTTRSECIPLLRNIAYTLQCGREAFPKRASVVARSHEEAASALKKLASSDFLQEDADATKYLHAEPASIVMCFPGQGSHYSGMARALYNDGQGVGRFFREYFDEICAKFKAHLNFELHDAVFAQDNDTFKKPQVTQPAIFAVELALAQTLIGLGIQPVAVAGHSIGEYVAATVAGVLEVEDAVMLVAERAKATAELATGEGAMLFAKLSSENAKVVIEQHRGLSLAIAAINGPEHIVISGSTQAIDVLSESLKSDGVLCRRLQVTHAFHSDMMAPVATRLVQCANTIHVGTPCISLTSNVSGRWISGGSDNEMSDPEYWGRHVVGTVRWKENVDAILRWSPTAVIEVGPGNTLISLLSKCMAATAGTAHMQLTKTFTSLPHARDQSSDDCTVFNKLLADLWEEGVDINWTLYNRGCLKAGQSHRSECIPLQRVPLPTYSFEKTCHWTNAKASIYVTPEEELASVYKVDWQLFKEIPASSTETNVPRTSPMIVTLGPDEITINEAIVEATKSVYGVVLVMQYPVDVLEGPLHYSSLQSYEIDMGWSFLRFVQDLTRHTTSGCITMICPASLLGALSVGASRSVEQEYPNLHLTRIFMPIPDHFVPYLRLQETPSSNFNLLLDCCKGQSDVLLPDGLVTGGRILAQTLKPMPLTNTRPESRPRPVFAIDEGDRGIYIITGGTGALGQALIKRLVLKHKVPEERILLLSRNSNANGKPFPYIRTIQVDCSDPLQLKSIEEIQSIQAVSGIFHLAGSLDDAVVINQSRERLSKVVAPKAAITTLLEIAKKQVWNPKFVLAYSSTTSLLGYAGQSNYGAANAILDQMATWQGYSTPIIAVNWGSWGGIGMAAEGTKAYKTSIRQGDLPMSTSAAIGALEALFENLFTQSTVSGQYAITGMNWAVSPWRMHPILRNILETEQRQGKDPSSTSFSANVPAVVSSSADIQQCVEAVLSNHLSRWDPKETLAALGLDSLDMLQLVRDLSNTFVIEVGLQDVMRSGQTLSEFVQYIVKQVKCIGEINCV